MANVSHQLRVPLNGVLGMQGILLETRLDRTQRDHLRSAQLAATTLLDLINDILDFSKIEAGQMMLDATPFDLRGLVEDVLDQQAVAAGDELQQAQQRDRVRAARAPYVDGQGPGQRAQRGQATADPAQSLGDVGMARWYEKPP